MKEETKLRICIILDVTFSETRKKNKDSELTGNKHYR
jgi:hypothetical protein